MMVRPIQRTPIAKVITKTRIAGKGEPMLRDSLQNLINNPGRKWDCKLGGIINSLDEETAETLVQALCSNTSTMGLVRALKDDGIPISREYLGEKRNTCFKGGSSNCCLQQSDSKEKSK